MATGEVQARGVPVLTVGLPAVLEVAVQVPAAQVPAARAGTDGIVEVARVARAGAARDRRAGAVANDPIRAVRRQVAAVGAASGSHSRRLALRSRRRLSRCASSGRWRVLA